MQRFVALLRAVNVGGASKLPMERLRELCASVGFTKVQTYIASGNVVFETSLSKGAAGAALAQALEHYAGKPVGVLLRTPEEMAAVYAANPFPDAPGNKVAVHFLTQPLSPGALDTVRGQVAEEIAAGKNEIYVHYPDGQGRSRLVIPVAKDGTARNLNTVGKLVELSRTGYADA